MRSARSLLAALVCAAISVIFIRGGFLYTLYLLPLGIAAYCFKPPVMWLTALFALAGNAAAGIALTAMMGLETGGLYRDLGFFSIALIVFCWIASPQDILPSFLRLSLVGRFIVAAVILACAMIPMILAVGNNPAARNFITAQAEAIASVYNKSAGQDPVASSLAEQTITSESIISSVIYAGLRGGAFLSCLLFLFMNHQIALLVSWLIKRERTGNSIMAFHVHPRLVWVLSLALLGILAGVYFKISGVEIAGWNILVISGIFYLVQGGGILFYFLSRPSLPPFLRLAFNALLILLILSPGINVAALVALALLGVAENWVPFRTPKTNGSSSTPGM